MNENKELTEKELEELTDINYNYNYKYTGNNSANEEFRELTEEELEQINAPGMSQYEYEYLMKLRNEQLQNNNFGRKR